VLRHYMGLSEEQAAQAMVITIGAVRSHLAAACPRSSTRPAGMIAEMIIDRVLRHPGTTGPPHDGARSQRSSPCSATARRGDAYDRSAAGE
jgi:hypothetical protein